MAAVKPRGYRPWSADDIATLRAAYADTPTDAIAAALGRAVSTVYGKASAGPEEERGMPVRRVVRPADPRRIRRPVKPPSRVSIPLGRGLRFLGRFSRGD